MNRFFTEEADAFIGQKVIEYNRASTDKEKLTLESIVKERTGILLYLIPQRNLYIKEEDLSGYYLDVIKDIDRIIGSYAISGRSYIAYLTQICRYRCMRYIRKKEKAELHKYGQAQEPRKKELDASGELKIAKESPENLFLQPLQTELGMQQGLEAGDGSHKAQNSIAIPAIHSLEGNSNAMEYTVSTMMRDPITEIAL